MLYTMWKVLAGTTLSSVALLGLVYSTIGQEMRIPVLDLTAPAIKPALFAELPANKQTVPILAQQPVAPNLPAPPSGIPPTIAETPPPSVPTSNSADEFKARIESLERKNQDLLEALKGLQNASPPAQPSTPTDTNGGVLSTNDVKKIVGDYMATREEQAKQADAVKVQDPPRFIVGKQLGLTGAFTQGGVGSGNSQMWFDTADKAFRLHVGARIQPDVVFGAKARSDSGNDIEQGKGGTGPFLEGFNFRRARLEMDGWLYDNIDFFVEFDWANTPFNTGVTSAIKTAAGTPTGQQPFTNILNAPAPTDVWAGVNNIPYVGMVRFGNLKPVIGLDHLTSSRYLDFMERSIGFDQYYNRNNGFEPGFLIANNTADERLTWAFSATRTSNGPFAYNQGGGGWDYTGRLTWLPYYEDNGRRMIHLGLGAKQQQLDESTGLPLAHFNGRWLLRNSQSGFQNVTSTVLLVGKDQQIIQPELFVNMGPLSVQAEYLGSRVSGVTRYSNQVVEKVTIASTNYVSHAAYVQAMYFLTGEHRPYGKTYTHGSGPAPTRVVPNRNFFWVAGQGGNGNPFSCGAWQIGARYNYATLNDGVINGGTVHELTVGLNWFLNPNIKYQWNYDIGHRDLSAAGGNSNGYFQGFGMRMALDF